MSYGECSVDSPSGRECDRFGGHQGPHSWESSEPIVSTYTEEQIIDAFWKALDVTKVGSGAGNAIIYGMLENLKRK